APFPPPTGFTFFRNTGHPAVEHAAGRGKGDAKVCEEQRTGNMAGRVQNQRRHHRELRFEPLETRTLLAADVIISEFLASNNGGLLAGDGASSDWIELYNTTSVPIDLSGYFLTDKSDDLDQWAFPPGTMIGAHSTLLVFASDKANSPPAGELHTNFKI